MMSRSALKTLCPLDAEGQALMRKAYDHWGSVVGWRPTLRLPRTIADLGSFQRHSSAHPMEAPSVSR